MATYGYEPDTSGPASQHVVKLLSGEDLEVMTEVEARWFTESQQRYLAENKFEDVTDLQDMDRLLCLELLMFRWNQHLAKGRDYEGNLVDDDLLRKQVKEQSEAITKLKQALNLDKKSRDAALSEGNFHAWFMDVKRRAKLFGIHRENQLNRALALMNELSAIIGSYDRADAEERKKLGFETELEIVAWCRDTMLPQFREIDEYFIEHEQKLWKRDL